MNFRQKVEAKYTIEVKAGIKDLLKKLALGLVGVAMLSQSAFGIQLKNPDAMQKTAKQVVMEIGKDTEPDAKYDLKMDKKQMGGLQNVTFSFMKNGKVAGQLKFIGTKSDTINTVKLGFSEDGKDDYAISNVAKILYTTIQEKIQKEAK